MEQPVKKKPHPQEESSEILVRIFGQDISSTKSIYVGLTKIKGISWPLANLICLQLGISRNKKISELSKDDIAVIEKNITNLNAPTFMKNRRGDLEDGEDKHLLTNDLDVQREFDIKRLKKMRSYKGVRHSYGLPVRGQKTRSHFRTKGKSVGVAKKNDKKA